MAEMPSITLISSLLNVKYQMEIWLMSFSIWRIPITAQQRHQSSSSNTFPIIQLLHFSATWDSSSRMMTRNQLLNQSHAPFKSVTRKTLTVFAIPAATIQQWPACNSTGLFGRRSNLVGRFLSRCSYIFNILTQLDCIYSTITNTDITSYNIYTHAIWNTVIFNFFWVFHSQPFFLCRPLWRNRYQKMWNLISGVVHLLMRPRNS